MDTKIVAAVCAGAVWTSIGAASAAQYLTTRSSDKPNSSSNTPLLSNSYPNKLHSYRTECYLLNHPRLKILGNFRLPPPRHQNHPRERTCFRPPPTRTATSSRTGASLPLPMLQSLAPPTPPSFNA
ncbi:hypothetical protein BT96DRAFT_1024435 [Gymnopus androsaceus JB14]|uniref:Uncharacterized protein n=1 Tax=Gymnopus androsaceus JB14 TaxID=1447944 RepID=A0A6A4GZW0_9AGAR|nr:hypothetical protein BT96DRAFT_1024435 [Gymnopus androsaceus JB14]